jgi:hypothetical protein
MRMGIGGAQSGSRYEYEVMFLYALHELTSMSKTLRGTDIWAVV